MGLAYLLHPLQLGPWIEPLTALNTRELTVLCALALKERPKDTANRLGISTKTVYMVRTDLFQQLKKGLEPPRGDYPASDFVALPAADLHVFHAAVVAFALGSWAWTAVAWQKWGELRRFRSFAVLNAHLQGPLEDVRSEEALAQVRVLEHLVGMQDRSTLHRAGVWNVLTTAERAVVQGILADKTVQEMAKDLACTTSHVYNLRASIRRKWELDPEQQMRAAIKQHLREV
jgi:FixJ family two-component response regulator